MRGFGPSSALVRSASILAIASGLLAPALAAAQDVPQQDPQTVPPVQAQQGTPQADTAPILPAPAEPDSAVTGTVSTPTDAVPTGQAVRTGEEGGVANEVVVTGVRASLERSIAIKRNSTGVVDAISAEDIGKFPDTNLAESLQRITGVAINRVNGEGSQVTVRGFGPGYNLVTLNGRTLASSDVGVVGGDGNSDGAQGTSRSFDFDNLASEGVKTLEVYKTGRAAVPSGGIGATINVVTRRPLDAHQSGFNGSIGGKLDYDTSVDDCIACGSKVTPEVTGLLSWSNPNETFGVSVFGSYQKRHFSTEQTGGNDWNIVPYSTFLGYTTPTTVINNAPTDPNTLVGVANDSRSDFSEGSRERLNGQAVVQFRPTDSLTLTVDALYARNSATERRSDSSNWFNRPFDEVTFSGNDVIDDVLYMHETLSPTKDGPGSENQYRATKNTLQDYGANAQWNFADNLTLGVDGHYSKSASLPDNPNGASSTLVAIAGKGIHSHSVDYSSGVPVMVFDFDDTAANGSTAQGDRNGMLDVGDLGSQVLRTYTSTQRQRIKEGRADLGWDLGGGSRFDAGVDYRDAYMRSTQTSTYNALGDWGVGDPGDVERLAPGQMFEFCLACKFKNYDLQATGNALKAYRTENAAQLFDTLLAGYGQTPSPSGSVDNRVSEKILSFYGQLTWKGDIAGHAASLVAGARYEETRSRSTSFQDVPNAIVWQADNDTMVTYSGNDALSVKSKYNNLLPSMDFQVELKRNLIGRVSFSKTIARTDYSNLFASTSVGGPPRPTALGGIATASQRNPNLVPLSSDNFDLSLEYYFKPDSYVSVGFFDKRVHNFVGSTIVDQPLFGLRDPSSGQAGTRSGTAKAQLQSIGANLSDDNLFTMTELVDRLGPAAALAEFQAHYHNGSLDADYRDQQLKDYDVVANTDDPLYQFSTSQPINNRDANEYGFEIAGQYFLGDTGIGVAASYTYVHSNVGIDNAAPTDVDQFALVGLSDTANATLIYDKYGISARLAYNWRGKFLSQLNRDSYHNPVYTEPFGQLDLNVSYDVTPNIALSFEAINLTEESVRQYLRTKDELIFAQDLRRRFLFGARYRF